MTARRLWWAALDQEAELRLDSALTLLRAARAADPTSLPAQHDYLRLMIERGGERELGGDPALGPCLAALSATRRQEAYRPAPRSSASTPRTVCEGSLVSLYARLRLPLAEELRLLEAAARAVPELWQGWDQWSVVLSAAGRPEQAEAVLREGATRVGHPLSRTLVLARLVRARARRGDTAGALALQGTLAAAVGRERRPGIRWAFLEVAGAVTRGDVRREVESALLERIRLARSQGAWARETSDLTTLGGIIGDGGEPARALQYHDRQVAIADSVGVPRLQLLGYVKRGRAYSKLGRLREAERDLLRAIEVGTGTEDLWDLAEAYHNLAHTYEGAGRWSEAARAADRFVTLTATSGFGSLRMMSHHDAGLIRWKAGWHAAARLDFAAMIRVIDEIEQDHYWAGEYYERIGELARALDYYRRGVWGPGSSIPDAKSLGGLARVYDALGYADSAEAAARRHDAVTRTWAPTDVPLLPDLLARHGRLEEATATAGRWAAERLAAGNVHGAARASLQLGGLLLRRGDLDAALREAVRAESLALQLELTDELIQARRLAGTALLRLGRQAPALRQLRDAARLARAHPTADAILGTELALAEALALTEDAGEALAAYDRAARSVEAVTERLALDWDRAGYRERHLAPFDGAVRVLLGRPHAAHTLEALAAWSQRRKGAALALVSGAAVGVGRSDPEALARLQGRLAADQALLDYIMLDSAVAVLVVLRDRAHLVPLAATTSRAGRLIDRLRRPLLATHAGRVDLARARFDLTIAGELYRDLVGPLVPLLGSVRRLVIVPDGALHALPFGALVTEPPADAGTASDYHGARYLIDDYEVTYLPSARAVGDAASPRADQAGAASVLAVEWGAPGGGEEVESIRRVWPQGLVTVLRGGAATETTVRATSRQYSVLHFAVHAEADGEDPLASHLRLAADQTHDGYYHLVEITSEQRTPALVVLSACETLSGRLYAGEGLMALARAFLASGARHVVATHWPVGSAAAPLMERFYRGLSAGEGPASALRAAKLELRSARETAHPFFWAGFELVSRG